jgi:hypothetical protein
MKRKIIASVAIAAMIAIVAIVPAVSQKPINSKPLTRLSICETLTLPEGNSCIIIPDISPSDADMNLHWESDNDSIAKTDDNEIYAVHEGTATVTVTDSITGLSARCVVTVEE